MAKKTIAEEAFEVGWSFHSFIHSSHCFDARDLARFFACVDHPKWVFSCVKEYDNQIVHWMHHTKDESIVIAKRVLMDRIRQLAGKDAADWRDDDSPQSETTFGVCKVPDVTESTYCGPG